MIYIIAILIGLIIMSLSILHRRRLQQSAIEPTIILKNSGWSAEDFALNNITEYFNKNGTVEKIKVDAEGFEYFKTTGFSETVNFDNPNLKEFVDVGGVVNVIRDGSIQNSPSLTKIDCPEVVTMAANPFYSGFTTFPNFTELHLPKMTNLGVWGQTSTHTRTFYVCGSGINCTFNSVLQTAGDGGTMHPEIQWLINNRNPNITWV